jgi:putative ABC transport system substrate-binding protein
MPGEIERAVAAFAGSPNGGLIVTAGGAAVRHRALIVTLAARHKLPAVYWERFFVAAGGLISYGADLIENYRRAADYGCVPWAFGTSRLLPDRRGRTRTSRG